ncbi:HNH endonuclease signature motif containing protein [Humibacter soli]
MKDLGAELGTATAAVKAALTVRQVPTLVDDELLKAMGAIEVLGRSVDALRVAVAAEAQERSRTSLGSDRLSARKGCRTANELIARVTQVTESTAARRSRLGATIRVRETLTGEVLPPIFAALAGAMDAGALGMDSAIAMTAVLNAVASRAEPGLLEQAERALVGCALGVEVTTGEPIVPFTADQTRIQAIQWQVALDPDGVEAREDHAMIARGITKIGTRNGLVRYSMHLLPEIAGKFDRAADSCLSPKTTGRFLTPEEEADAEVNGDTRTPVQQRHDVFAAMVDAAVRSGELPTVGGASPTVLVSVSADDLEPESEPEGAFTAGSTAGVAAPIGAGWIDGVEIPISLRAVKQFVCTGGAQKVLFDRKGKIIALGSPERVFTPQQRRAISLRDGGCVIPGCQIPAGWCEIHHVIEHARGGPTHTDNGVMLCWFHHRTIEASGWQVQLRDGVPHVRPPWWVDHERRWRRASKSRTGPRRDGAAFTRDAVFTRDAGAT